MVQTQAFQVQAQTETDVPSALTREPGGPETEINAEVRLAEIKLEMMKFEKQCTIS
jgi:hypothetical protein